MKQLAGFAWFLLGCWIAVGIWRLGNRPMMEYHAHYTTEKVTRNYSGLPPLDEMEAKVKP